MAMLLSSGVVILYKPELYRTLNMCYSLFAIIDLRNICTR